MTVPVGATVVSAADPVVFVEQAQPAAPAVQPAAPALQQAAPASPPPVTWFYCTEPAGYYPYVQTCRRPWVRVSPDPMHPVAVPPASVQ